MAASTTKNETLKALRAARTTMMSAAFVLRLDRQTQATQEEAAQALWKTQHAIRRLEDAEIGAIRDSLVDNEPALTAGRHRLEQTLQNVRRVRSVLAGVSRFLGVVGKVITLIA